MWGASLMKSLILFCVLFLSLNTWASTYNIEFPVTKYSLKNGLTVLLHVDSSAPLVSVQQWYRVGSRNEKLGRTGLAHFFEHMMFKGCLLYTSPSPRDRG